MFFQHATELLNQMLASTATRSTGLALYFCNLTILDLSKNRIESTKPFAHLSALEELWLSSNNITSFDDLAPLSAVSRTSPDSSSSAEVGDGAEEGTTSPSNPPQLEGIYVEFNPVAEEFEYRKRLAAMIPSLQTIDGVKISGYGDGAGAGVGAVVSLEERLRQYQEQALERARQQSMEQAQGDA